MAGTFILSLDCEGMWGMADKPHDQRNYITHRGLIENYQTLVDLFNKYDIPVTFAFVGMFIVTEQEREYFEPKLDDIPYNGQDWMAHYRQERDNGQMDGWFCPEALEIVNQAGIHEIATHGFTHIPFDQSNDFQHIYEREMQLIKELGEMKGVEFKTMVYPRNQIGHVDQLKTANILAYRTLLNQPGGSLARLLRECNIFEKSQNPLPAGNSAIPIPAGYFLNWRSGARGYIPDALTQMRWDSILNDACENNGVAHLWSHPHNFISAPSTLNSLEGILKKVVALRDKGKLKVELQEQYIQNI